MFGQLKRWLDPSLSPAAQTLARAERQKVFSNIYCANAWGGEESKSGPGSGVARTTSFRAEIENLFQKLKPRTLLDAPCGDFNWLSHFALGVDNYIGVDIVPDVIADNQTKYANAQRTFLLRDIVCDDLPRADVVFCRDGLVHLNNADVFSTLKNFKRSGSVWLLTNTFVSHHDNSDIETGSWQPLNLEDPPFRLPRPAHLIDEQCLGYDGQYRDKMLALWRLQDLAV